MAKSPTSSHPSLSHPRQGRGDESQGGNDEDEDDTESEDDLSDDDDANDDVFSLKEDEYDEDGENQVVPWSFSSSCPPPMVESSSSGEEDRFSDSKRLLENGDLLSDVSMTIFHFIYFSVFLFKFIFLKFPVNQTAVY